MTRHPGHHAWLQYGLITITSEMLNNSELGFWRCPTIEKKSKSLCLFFCWNICGPTALCNFKLYKIELLLWTYIPTETFSTSELQNQSYDVPRLLKSHYLGALKLWKGQSGWRNILLYSRGCCLFQKKINDQDWQSAGLEAAGASSLAAILVELRDWVCASEWAWLFLATETRNHFQN